MSEPGEKTPVGHPFMPEEFEEARRHVGYLSDPMPHRLVATVDAANKRVRDLEAAIELAVDDESLAFIRDKDGMVRPVLIVNDCFAFATADCEPADWSDLPDLLKRVRNEGWPAVVRWTAEHREVKPLASVESDMLAFDKERAAREKAEADCAAMGEQVGALLQMRNAVSELGDEVLSPDDPAAPAALAVALPVVFYDKQAKEKGWPAEIGDHLGAPLLERLRRLEILEAVVLGRASEEVLLSFRYPDPPEPDVDADPKNKSYWDGWADAHEGLKALAEVDGEEQKGG